MTTLSPRPPYTAEELQKLYPEGLELQLVQILLRHGERSPVSPRFRNAGLSPYWPYCNAARQMTSAIMTTKDWTQWSGFKWRRRLETFGEDDGPVVALGPDGEFDGVCNPGELTDKGRETTMALGERIRKLYVDQLGFMPKLITDSDMIYLRATPVPRALESVQQTFQGLYPPTARTASFPPPTILIRGPGDETLFPNDGACRRFAQLSRGFAQRAADRWNDSDELDYVTKKVGKWMPPTADKATGKESSQRVAVDSHPRLSGVMDTTMSTLAHGKQTRLPSEFYDQKVLDVLQKIGTEEWFAGYKESREYRAVGIGALLGDIVTRMAGSVERDGQDGLREVGQRFGEASRGRGGELGIKMALSGCHDTTLAASLSSLGAFNTDKWPPYTSHIAFELFRRKRSVNGVDAVDGLAVRDIGSSKGSSSSSEDNGRTTAMKQTQNRDEPLEKGWWARLFSSVTTSAERSKDKHHSDDRPIARRPMSVLSQKEKAKLEDHFVRIRYNDVPVTIPGCAQKGNHLEGDESFCTLAAFKAIVDDFTPQNWKEACSSNLEAPAFPSKPEPAGYASYSPT